MVTGATGFFGSHLCRRLREEDAEVFATSRAAREDVGARFRWLQADLNDTSAVRRMLIDVRPDIVFHLSGIATAHSGLELVLPTLHTNLVSTVNLLTVAAEIGIARVILAGSLQEPKPDHAEPTPSSPYAAAKWASSAYGRMFRRIYGLPVVNLRVFQTYGPGQDVQKLIPYVTLALLRQQRPELSNGKWEADWIYIDDVISGLLAAARGSRCAEAHDRYRLRQPYFRARDRDAARSPDGLARDPDIWRNARPAVRTCARSGCGWRAERIELETGRFNDRRASAYRGRLQANY